MTELEVHELCSIFPPMATTELEELAADIRENGQREPIVLYRGKILDGRNRYFACLMEGIRPHFEELESDESDLLSFVVSRNLHRRHLTESQRAMVANRLANMQQGNQPSKAQICALTTPSISQREAAETLNVSRRSVQQARKVQEHGEPELVAAVDAGTVSVSDAARIAKQPAESQRSAVAAVRAGKASTLTKAAKSMSPNKRQSVADGFERLEKAIGAMARAHDDLAQLLGIKKRASVFDAIHAARVQTNFWRMSACPAKGSGNAPAESGPSAQVEQLEEVCQ